jgi:hypothetical protein
MKSRIALFVLFVLAAATAFAQDTPATQSDAQKSFDKLKALAGTWEGSFEGHRLDVTLRATSMGNAIMHEMKGDGPQDPITMFNLDADRLLLTHYCDAGNRPRMVGKISPDGKTLEFEFLDVSGSTQNGHMQHVTFTFIDPDHHTEKWEFAMADGKSMGGVLELKRTK